MLWRVENTEKYFLSSMHILPDHDAELDTVILNLLPKMSKVVFESDLSQAKEPAFATYQDGQQLHQIIPSDLYDKSSRLWGTMRINTVLDSCKPWWAALLIGITAAQKRGYVLEQGVEHQVLARVPSDRRIYLENPELPLLVFEQAPLAEQIVSLELCCKGEDAIIEDFNSIHKMWRTSDLGALSMYLDSRRAKQPSTYSGLIEKRNLAWAPKIQKLLVEDGATLFVLGALHFVGPNKLPDCLSKDQRVELQKIC